MKKIHFILGALLAANTAHAGDFDDVSNYLSQKANDTQDYLSQHNPADTVKQDASQYEQQRDSTGDINPVNHVNVGQR